MHGTGRNTRNFLFVEDVARAFDVVLHKGEVGNVYNIGGSNEFANIDVARKLLVEMGRAGDGSPEAIARAEAEVITWAPDRPFNDGASRLPLLPSARASPSNPASPSLPQCTTTWTVASWRRWGGVRR